MVERADLISITAKRTIATSNILILQLIPKAWRRRRRGEAGANSLTPSSASSSNFVVIASSFCRFMPRGDRSREEWRTPFCGAIVLFLAGVVGVRESSQIRPKKWE